MKRFSLTSSFLAPVFGASLMVAASLSGCGSDKPANNAETKKISAIELADVDVYQLETQVLSGSLPVSGALQPIVQTAVKSRVSAEVNEVFVREGMAVTKGQSLAQLGLQDIGARLKQAEATLAAAKVEAALSRILADRNKQLFEKKYFSEIEYQRSEGEAQLREENVRAQQAVVDMARKAMTDASVRSPVSGIIAHRYIEPGTTVNVESRLFDIVELSKMELAVPVPASEIAQVKSGQAVKFTVTGFGDRQFAGTVVRINPVADPGTRAIMVYAQVDNADGVLRGGMYARGEIVVGASGEGLTVPLEALHGGSNGVEPWVIVLRNGKLEKQILEAGAKDERLDRIIVKSGLKAGDTVVVARLTDKAVGQAARLESSTQP